MFRAMALVVVGVIAALAMANIAIPGALGGTTAASDRLAFVKEFVRELGAVANIMTEANLQIASAADRDQLLRDEIYAFTRMKLELLSDEQQMRTVNFAPPFDTLGPSLAELLQGKQALTEKFIEGATAILSGPKPGVDYGALAASLPKLRAQLDYIDETIFQATTPVFALLISDTPNKAGEMSRLIITHDERNELIAQINMTFGASLEQKDASYTVTSAKLLRAFLQKDWKSSDDPD